MRLELLRRHVWAGCVELLGAVQAADTGQPGVLDAFGEWLCLHGKLGDGVEVRVFHDGLEFVTVGVLLLQLIEG